MARQMTSYMGAGLGPYATMLDLEDGGEQVAMLPPQPVQPMDYERPLVSEAPSMPAPDVMRVRDLSRYQAAAEAPAPMEPPTGVDVYRAPDYGDDMDLDAIRDAQGIASKQRLVGGIFGSAMKDRGRGAELRRSLDQRARSTVGDVMTRRQQYRDQYVAGQEGERNRQKGAVAKARAEQLNASTQQQMQLAQQEAARIAALQDPESAESERARRTLAAVAPSLAQAITPDMSAAQVQDLIKPGFSAQLRQREIQLQGAQRMELERLKQAGKRRGRGGAGGAFGGMSRPEREAYLQNRFGLDDTESSMVAANKKMFEKFMPGGAVYSDQKEAQSGELDYQDQMGLRMFAQNIVKTGVLRTYGDVMRAANSIEDAKITVPKKLLAQYGGDLGKALLDGASPQFSQFNQNLQVLSNNLIKAMSGAAVTAQEYERFQQALGSGAIRSPERVKYFLKQLQKATEDDLNTLAASMSDQGLAEFVERVGPSVPFPAYIRQRARRGAGGKSGAGKATRSPKAPEGTTLMVGPDNKVRAIKTEMVEQAKRDNFRALGGASGER